MRTLTSAIAMTAWVIVCPAAQGSSQPPAPIHVLQITAGPSGSEEKGSFILKEERSIFSRSDDREVIVLFQWDGTSGAHNSGRSFLGRRRDSSCSLR